jgi:RND superfamily putative drug exporter
MVLVPATMRLLGRANWWLPGWLDRLLPAVDVHGRDADAEPVRVTDVTDVTDVTGADHGFAAAPAPAR